MQHPELGMNLDEIGKAALALRTAAGEGAAGGVSAIPANGSSWAELARQLAQEIGVRPDYAERLLDDYVGYARTGLDASGVPLSDYVWLVGVHCVKGD
jgi:hypothetical protein